MSSIEKTIENLRKNGIEAVFAEDKQAVCKKVGEMLFDGCTITAGGSVSLKESGVWDIINDKKYNFYDRAKQGITPEEQEEAFKAAIGCDFFFCSSNAVTENGELVNVDGRANRISSISFGPKKVVMIVGVNKIVSDVKEGFLRIKKIAAPKNCVRLGIDTPCSKLGHCVSLEKNSNPAMTDGCMNEHRICANYLVSAKQTVKNRILVIICGESLGY